MTSMIGRVLRMVTVATRFTDAWRGGPARASAPATAVAAETARPSGRRPEDIQALDARFDAWKGEGATKISFELEDSVRRFIETDHELAVERAVLRGDGDDEFQLLLQAAKQGFASAAKLVADRNEFCADAAANQLIEIGSSCPALADEIRAMKRIFEERAAAAQDEIRKAGCGEAGVWSGIEARMRVAFLRSTRVRARALGLLFGPFNSGKGD